MSLSHLVIVGTSHPIQCGSSKVSASKVEAFAEEIRALIAKHCVTRVTEEMSADGLKNYGVTSTVAQKIAESLTLEHQFLDLTHQQKNALDMTDARLPSLLDPACSSESWQERRSRLEVLDDEVRERVMAFRLMTSPESPVLFICGANHVAPMERIGKLLGIRCRIAHYDFGSA